METIVSSCTTVSETRKHGQRHLESEAFGAKSFREKKVAFLALANAFDHCSSFALMTVMTAARLHFNLQNI